MCQKPFVRGSFEFGCGQCMPCRINRRRVWTARLLLESRLHDNYSFVTLTYDDENLPENYSLDIRHYQLFLKRLRKRLNPRKISYYIVGEYGTETCRPHYHVVLYGVVSRPSLLTNKIDRRLYLSDELAVYDAWSLGNVHFGEVTPASIAYACKHITKGLNNGDDVLGRIPEFSRMSLRPAIGKRAMVDFADWLVTEKGSEYIAENGDVFSQFRHDGEKYAFGRYLKGILRNEVGMEDVWSLVAQRLSFLERNNIVDYYDFKKKSDIRRVHASKARHAVTLQHSRNKL